MDKAQKHAKNNNLWYLNFKIDGQYRKKKGGSLEYRGSVPKKMERRLWNIIHDMIKAGGEKEEKEDG
jgi:hypothetical protein